MVLNLSLEANSTTDYLSQLPVEMKMLIFGYLKIEDRKNSRLVCSDWLSILNSSVKINVLLNDATVTTVKNCTAMGVESLRVNNLRKRVTLSSSRSMSIPEARIIYIDSENSKENLMNIWRYGFTKVKKLLLGNSSLAPLTSPNISSVISFINWPVLVELSVEIVELAGKNGTWDSIAHRHHVQALTQFFKLLNIPSVRNICIHVECGFMNSSRKHHPLPDFYIQLLMFMVRHKGSLVSLNAYMRLKFADLISMNIKSIPIESLQLQKLALNFDLAHALFALNLSLAGNCLKNLTLDKSFWLRRPFLDIPEQFVTTVKRNLHTLETFTLLRMNLNCCWFDGCESLQSLKLLVWCPQNMLNRSMLPALTKFHFELYFIPEMNDDNGETLIRDNLLIWIESCMSNLEELFLQFNTDICFSIRNYNSLMCRLPKLRTLKLSKVIPDDFIELSENDAAIKYTLKSVVPIRDPTYYTFEMQRKL